MQRLEKKIVGLIILLGINQNLIDLTVYLPCMNVGEV